MQVYDISDPTKPTYVAGRDITGGEKERGVGAISTLTVFGDYLFLGFDTLYEKSPACSQVVGNAIGCVLHIYNVSNPTKPVFIKGRDILKDLDRSKSFARISSLVSHNNYLFAGLTTYGNHTCEKAEESSFGCGLKVYSLTY